MNLIQKRNAPVKQVKTQSYPVEAQDANALRVELGVLEGEKGPRAKKTLALVSRNKALDEKPLLARAKSELTPELYKKYFTQLEMLTFIDDNKDEKDLCTRGTRNALFCILATALTCLALEAPTLVFGIFLIGIVYYFWHHIPERAREFYIAYKPKEMVSLEVTEFSIDIDGRSERFLDLKISSQGQTLNHEVLSAKDQWAVRLPADYMHQGDIKWTVLPHNLTPDSIKSTNENVLANYSALDSAPSNQEEQALENELMKLQAEEKELIEKIENLEKENSDLRNRVSN